MPDPNSKPDKPPKVFISYSWSSPGHQNQIREWADRLAGDGIEIILDQYDLKEGQDKYAFMERMVTDSSVSHALVFSDKIYAEKADGRQGGVGTETQIISKGVYDSVEESKFIPIVCERSEDGEPWLPTFLKSRVWIDFSTFEAVNGNWEKLIRRLHGKPIYEKPQVGKPPRYIVADDRAPTNPVAGKYATLRLAILEEKKGLKIYRSDFLQACVSYTSSVHADKTVPAEEALLASWSKLTPVRDQLIDWVMLEATAGPSEDFSIALIDLLENLSKIRQPQFEANLRDPVAMEVRALFTYEAFLYSIAVLIKTGAWKILRTVFTASFLLTESDNYGRPRFQYFDSFWTSSRLLATHLRSPEGQQYICPVGEIIKRRATREDLPFKSLIEADLLIVLNALLSKHARWFPQLLIYAGYVARFPLFQRAIQRRGFEKLQQIIGPLDGDQLRASAKVGMERLNTNSWSNGWHDYPTVFWDAMNMDDLDREP